MSKSMAGRSRTRALTLGLGVLIVALPSVADAAPLTVATRTRVPVAQSGALASGVVEHRTLALHGVPVRGAYVRVWVGADGHERVLAQRRPVGEPALLPSQARIDAAEVAAILATHPSTAAAPTPTTPPMLVYRLVLGEPVLVWEAAMPLTLRPVPSRMRVWVSAATGRVLDERDDVFASRARVFPENPAVTPVAVEVELDIDAQGPGVPLDGPRVAALNCAGQPPEDPEAVFPWYDEEDCYAVTGLLSDADGNYFPPVPDILYPAQSQDPDDDYAQLSMYYHSMRFFDRFAQLGVTSFPCEKSTMLANFHTLPPSGDLEFTPLNNAFYTNVCDIEDGPTMIFGQGSEVDFAYDGDVVYHELGHGIVELLSPDGLVDPQLRADGSLADARSINEALADYFNVVLTDDPHLADYVGRYSSSSRNSIRDAENTRTCPDSMNGEEHNDGEPFMAALWATRKRVGGDVLDPLVLQMLTRLPPDAALEDAAAVLLEIADDEVAAGTMRGDDHAVLVRSLDARGMVDCPRVVVDQDRVSAGITMYLRRRNGGGQPFYPGPLQLRYDVPDGIQRVFVRFRLTPSGSSNEVESRVLVRRADTPITYTYTLVAADEEVEVPKDGGQPDDPDPVREVILTTGDWDEMLQPVQYAPFEYQAEVTGLAAGQVLHIAVVDISTTAAVASSVRVQASEAIPPDPQDTDSEGAEPAPDGREVVGADEVVAGGCTCRTVASDRRRAVWPLVWLVSGLWLRRRGARRPVARAR